MRGKRHEVIDLHQEKNKRGAETPMQKAARVLTEARMPCEIKTEFHLKIGSLNYYPAKGTLHRDGELGTRKRVSLPALLAIIRDEGL